MTCNVYNPVSVEVSCPPTIEVLCKHGPELLLVSKNSNFEQMPNVSDKKLRIDHHGDTHGNSWVHFWKDLHTHLGSTSCEVSSAI